VSAPVAFWISRCAVCRREICIAGLVGKVRSQKCHDFLVFGRCQRHLGRLGVRKQLRRDVSESVLDPKIQDPFVPSLVEFTALVESKGIGARGPALAAPGGCSGGTNILIESQSTLDNRVDENKGLEKARVDEGEVGQLATAHTMADTDEGARHLGTERVDHM